MEQQKREQIERTTTNDIATQVVERLLKEGELNDNDNQSATEAVANTELKDDGNSSMVPPATLGTSCI